MLDARVLLYLPLSICLGAPRLVAQIVTIDREEGLILRRHRSTCASLAVR